MRKKTGLKAPMRLNYRDISWKVTGKVLEIVSVILWPAFLVKQLIKKGEKRWKG